jgi:hypothetical protein
MMAQYKELADFAASLDMKMAIVEVEVGESNNEAWQRHLQDHPHDVNAMIKVFNRPQMMRQVRPA